MSSEAQKLASKLWSAKTHQIRVTRNWLIVTEEVEYRGHACERCGMPYEKGRFHWHHRDPSKKHKKISWLCHQPCSERMLKAELEKCELLCASCHKAHHKQEASAT